ncbi:MAG: DUF1543 domain-containing protein [Sphingobacterium sp.]
MDLYMLVIGGKPDDRLIEQHDVFFGIGEELKDLVPQLYEFWPQLIGKMHIDSWRKVSKVSDYAINLRPRSSLNNTQVLKLFFVNLGGYKAGDMEEYHYKQLVVALDMSEAIKKAKESVFWKHHNSSHIDDKYGIDVDDIYEVKDLLNPSITESYSLEILTDEARPDDALEIGYLKISKLLKG